MSIKNKKISLEIKGKDFNKNIDVCTLIILNTPPRILKIFPLIKDKSIAENNGTLTIQYVEYKNYVQAMLGTLFLHILGPINILGIKSSVLNNFTLNSRQEVCTQIDGELRGNLPVSISALHSALELIV